MDRRNFIISHNVVSDFEGLVFSICHYYVLCRGDGDIRCIDESVVLSQVLSNGVILINVLDVISDFFYLNFINDKVILRIGYSLDIVRITLNRGILFKALIGDFCQNVHWGHVSRLCLDKVFHLRIF